jgi:AP-3 complex subunit mu
MLGDTDGNGWGSAALCHVEREGLRFLVPISKEGELRWLAGRSSIGADFKSIDDNAVNPMFAFAFLDSFLDTLGTYLGEVTETTLRNNFDTVYMVRAPSCRSAPLLTH